FFSPSLSGPYRSSPCRAAAASRHFCCFLFLNATSTTDIYTLSLHDALPIFILGSEANLSFLSVRIFHVLQRSNPPAYSDASALALVLVALILVLAGVQAWILRGRNFTSLTGKSYRRDRLELGKWKYVAGAFVAGYVFFAVVAPLAVVVLASFQPFPGVYSNLSTRNYFALFKNPALGDLFVVTATVSAIGAALGTVLAFTIAYVSERVSPLRRMLLRVTPMVPMAMPGVIGAV